MKKISKLLVLLPVFMVIANICFADSTFIRPRYTLTGIVAPGGGYVNANTFEFDVYLYHTNSDSTIFQYAGGQYFLLFNINVVNGGTLTYSIIGSDLDSSMRPRNPSIAGNLLRLAANSLPGAGNGPTISHTGLGTKIVKMRLSNTNPFNQADTINLRWRSELPNPYTKINAYTGVNNTVNTDITTPSTHSISGLVGIGNENPVANNVIPTEFALAQNYPNPFNPSTKIAYALPEEGRVTMTIFDITGKAVLKLLNSELKQPGNYDVNFNASNLASGIYFYRLEIQGAKRYESTKRMVLLK